SQGKGTITDVRVGEPVKRVVFVVVDISEASLSGEIAYFVITVADRLTWGHPMRKHSAQLVVSVTSDFVIGCVHLVGDPAELIVTPAIGLALSVHEHGEIAPSIVSVTDGFAVRVG